MCYSLKENECAICPKLCYIHMRGNITGFLYVNVGSIYIRGCILGIFQGKHFNI